MHLLCPSGNSGFLNLYSKLSIVQRSSKKTVFPFIIQKFPSLLDYPLIDSLLETGAVLPKYCIEKAYKNHYSLKEEIVGYLVAQGYKLYQTRLNLNLESELNDSVDDYSLFLSAFNGKQIKTDTLKKIYNENGFILCINSELDNALWEYLHKLLKADYKLGIEYLKYCQFDLKSTRSKIIKQLVFDMNTKLLKKPIFAIDSEIATEILLDSRIFGSFDKIYKFLQSFTDFDYCLDKVFVESVTNANVKYMHLLQLLLNADPKAVDRLRNALFVENMQENRCIESLFMTKFGKNQHGMSSSLCEFMINAFGLNHEFTRACFSDLLIGGIVNLQDVEPKSFNWSFLAKNDEIDRNIKTVHSIEAILLVGYPFTPSILSILSRFLLISNRVPLRCVYFMQQVEKMLLECVQTESVLEGIATFDEWLEAMDTFVIQDPEWLQLDGQNQSKSPLKQFNSLFSQSNNSNLRFLFSVKQLHSILYSQMLKKNQQKKSMMEAAAVGSFSEIAMESVNEKFKIPFKPFQDWFEESNGQKSWFKH